jgi:hypothetical protein
MWGQRRHHITDHCCLPPQVPKLTTKLICYSVPIARGRFLTFIQVSSVSNEWFCLWLKITLCLIFCNKKETFVNSLTALTALASLKTGFQRTSSSRRCPWLRVQVISLRPFWIQIAIYSQDLQNQSPAQLMSPHLPHPGL